MTSAILKGIYLLQPDVRLIPNDAGGVLLQLSPLRIMRVNASAFRVLLQCREGFSPEEVEPSCSPQQVNATLSFLDTLSAMHLVRWTPERDGWFPFVSIVVPVYNRAHEIGACIESLLRLNYPAHRRELIVVDDGSQDDTVSVVRRYGVKLLHLEHNGGQSAARNAGVREATGEVLAFTDSDCIADPDWLSELVPYFRDPRIALVGGGVSSFYNASWLDRYEEAKSPLSMGPDVVTCTREDSDFYVPTCNMLVRRDAYLDAGGLDEAWRLGEDVDLCWKLKKRGHRLLYVPAGRVSHKHRNRFVETFRRRFDYGTSEPHLYARHEEVEKRFPGEPFALMAILSCGLGLLMLPGVFFGLAGCLILGKALQNRTVLKKKANVPVTFGETLKATARNTFLLGYHLAFHMVRYHALLILALLLAFPAAYPLLLTLLILPPAVQFIRLNPRLPFPLFLCLFFVEQCAYQAGVFVSCAKIRRFRCYRFRFSGKKGPAGRAVEMSRA